MNYILNSRKESERKILPGIINFQTYNSPFLSWGVKNVLNQVSSHFGTVWGLRCD